MKKYLILFLSLLFFSCKYSAGNIFYQGNSVNNRDTKLTTISGPGTQSGEYKVLIFTDKHTGSISKSSNAKKILDWIDGQGADKPKFALDLGDSTDTGSEQEFIEYKSFCQTMESKGVTVYSTPGNHDLYNSGWQYWKKYSTSESAFYKFETGNFSWYSFDTATGNVGLSQLSELQKAFSSDPNPKIVFSHYPVIADKLIFCIQDTTERNILLSLFAKNNVKMTLGGHIHSNNRYNFGSFESIAVSSFLYSGKFGVLTVNETTGTVTFELID